MSRRFICAGLNLTTTKSKAVSTKSRAGGSQKKSERLEHHRLSTRERRTARHERYLDEFKRAGWAFRLWWLMLLGVMQNVVRPIAGYMAPLPRAGRSVRSPSRAGIVAAQSNLLEVRQVLSAGALDTSVIGGTGFVTTEFPGLDATASGIAVQSDGKIVVAGTAVQAGTKDFAVARYNTDLSLDLTFGCGDGIVTTDFPSGGQSGSDVATTIVIQADGRILVGGSSETNKFAMARYNANGALDTLLSLDGSMNAFIGESAQLHSLRLQPNGKIVAAGQRFGGLLPGFGNKFVDREFLLARFNADGTFDTSFDGDGSVTTLMPPLSGTLENAFAHPFDLAIQPDGKLVAAGIYALGSNPQFADASSHLNMAVIRYNTDGSLDSTFGFGGIQKISTTGSYDRANAVSIQPDSKILVTGTSAFDETYQTFQSVRLNSNGSFDTSLGVGGKVKTNLVGKDSSATRLLLQGDGRFIAAGWARSNANQTSFAHARFNANGILV